MEPKKSKSVPIVVLLLFLVAPQPFHDNIGDGCTPCNDILTCKAIFSRLTQLHEFAYFTNVLAFSMN